MIIYVLIIVWFISISLVVGTFGSKRKIGFMGAYITSLLFSPFLAMLFVLASDKTDKTDDCDRRLVFIVTFMIFVTFLVLLSNIINL